MNLTIMPLGAYQTNCYCLLDGDDLALIDPGDQSEKVLDYIKETGKSPKYIFLTHGHYDHTGSVVPVLEAYPEVQVFIHKGDGEGADARMFPISQQTNQLRFMAEGDKFPFGASEILVMETPGHSLGSVVLQFEDNLFTGDTLFCGSMGRTDFVGGINPPMILVFLAS